MIRGFYTALSGMMSSMTRQAVVADNIANVNTVGFKQSRTTQDDFEMEVMRTGDGVAYTRAGDFQLDVQGTLCTEQGYPVLDTAGHTIQPGKPFVVQADGTIVGTGQRIAIVGWPPGGVTRLGENLYSAGGQLQPGTGNIRQNCLEHSNTDLSTAMTELIQLQRTFQMSSRALSLQDGTIGDATSLGRLR